MISILFLFVFFFQLNSAEQSSNKAAEQVLNRIVYIRSFPSVIGEREWKELQLDRLITMLDRTKTSFGKWGLRQLLHPIDDKNQLQQRKKIITFLIDHPEIMHTVQSQLERMQRFETSLLSYWDENDVLNINSGQFYFSSFGLDALNKSSVMLNIGAASEMFTSWKFLLHYLALSGLSDEWSKWMHGETTEFNFIRGLKSGLETPLRYHSWQLSQLKDQQSYVLKDYLKAFSPFGSWRDRYEVLCKGYSIDTSQFGLPKMEAAVLSVGKLGAFIGATLPTLFFDYQWGNAIVSVAKRIISMNHDLNRLQSRVSEVAHGIDAIMNLRKIVLREGFNSTINFVLEGQDADLDSFIKKLLTRRFLQKPGYLYSRGHVLSMHREIQQVKDELISLLHSVSFIDAYCSIAQLYKESQNQRVVFSFPEFISSQKPLLDYRDAWLPLLSPAQAITNDLIFGVDGQPSKIIITGPNGGGKSTILKTLAPILAQSWCIVPAKRAQQTLFSKIRTSLAAHENLEEGLSTFMAEKKVMKELYDDIIASDEHHHILALIDEPYKGTVDDESAKRIYQFGKDIVGASHALVVIATHVKKPIMLEADTGGMFGNFQVKIRERSLGVFERLFKIEKGPADWWFEDGGKRSRFIDWISVQAIST